MTDTQAPLNEAKDPVATLSDPELLAGLSPEQQEKFLSAAMLLRSFVEREYVEPPISVETKLTSVGLAIRWKKPGFDDFTIYGFRQVGSPPPIPNPRSPTETDGISAVLVESHAYEGQLVDFLKEAETYHYLFYAERVSSPWFFRGVKVHRTSKLRFQVQIQTVPDALTPELETLKKQLEIARVKKSLANVERKPKSAAERKRSELDARIDEADIEFEYDSVIVPQFRQRKHDEIDNNNALSPEEKEKAHKKVDDFCDQLLLERSLHR